MWALPDERPLGVHGRSIGCDLHGGLGDVASFATAGGTLVLAVATFSAVRSSNRSARIAEESLLTAMRPLLIPSLSDDPVHKVLWNDRHTARVGGGRAIFEEDNGVIYLAIGLRNLGTGIALLHGWYPMPDQAFGIPHTCRLRSFAGSQSTSISPQAAPDTGRPPSGTPTIPFVAVF